MPGAGYSVRVTLVRGLLRVVCDSSSSLVSDRVRGGIRGAVDSGVDSSPDVSDSEGSVPDGSVPSGNPKSVVTGGLVLVIVDVVLDVVRVEVDAYVGWMKSIGACWGLSALLVSATTPHTTSAMTASAATLAPRTAGVE